MFDSWYWYLVDELRWHTVLSVLWIRKDLFQIWILPCQFILGPDPTRTQGEVRRRQNYTASVGIMGLPRLFSKSGFKLKCALVYLSYSKQGAVFRIQPHKQHKLCKKLVSDPQHCVL
jgi:hypothetical protein